MRHLLVAGHPLAVVAVGLFVSLACHPPRAVVTQHNDPMRTGAYLREHTLTVGAVRAQGLHTAYWRPVDGTMFAQVLYVPRVRIGSHRYDVAYAATANNTVYAYDAREARDSGTSRGLLWSKHLPVTPDPQLSTAWGIGSTPVIDLAERTLYVVYGINNGLPPPDGQGDGSFEAAWHLAALDIRSGAVFRDVVISGSVPSGVAPGHADFVAGRQWQRAALLLTTDPEDASVKYIWVAFASRWREETHNWHGWVVRYDAATFGPRGVFCTTPDRRANSEGGGIWEGGGGLAADQDGNAYFLTGNGPAGPNSYGNSIVKLAPHRTPKGGYDFHVSSFSAALDDPAHATEWANNDIDLGAGGETVIPGSTRVTGGGKTGVLYLMDFSSGLSKVQEFVAFTNTYDPPNRYRGWIGGPHLHGSPTYWAVSADTGFLYDWGEQDSLRRFAYDRHTGLLDIAHPLAGSIRALQLVMPGGMISLSANRTHEGILWVTLPESGVLGRLIAIDARTLQPLWETEVPSLGHFIPPTVADGRVFVATASGQFRVYELTPRLWHPRVPVRGPVPWFRIPPGDPAPRVQLVLQNLGPAAGRVAAPPDHHVLFTTAGRGVLVYTARPIAGAPAQIEWVESGAQEYLVDDVGLQPNMGFEGRGDTLGTRQGGGVWQVKDGSTLTTEVTASVDAPVRGAASWLLMTARAGPREGLLSDVSYVQRIATVGGGPSPDAASAEPGAHLRASYRAMYVFYGKRAKTGSPPR